MSAVVKLISELSELLKKTIADTQKIIQFKSKLFIMALALEDIKSYR